LPLPWNARHSKAVAGLGPVAQDSEPGLEPFGGRPRAGCSTCVQSVRVSPAVESKPPSESPVRSALPATCTVADSVKFHHRSTVKSDVIMFLAAMTQTAGPQATCRAKADRDTIPTDSEPTAVQPEWLLSSSTPATAFTSHYIPVCPPRHPRGH
jgi:hypothetical protein